MSDNTLQPKAAPADPAVPLPPGMIAGMEKWLQPGELSAWREGRLNFQQKLDLQRRFKVSQQDPKPGLAEEFGVRYPSIGDTMSQMDKMRLAHGIGTKPATRPDPVPLRDLPPEAREKLGRSKMLALDSVREIAQIDRRVAELNAPRMGMTFNLEQARDAELRRLIARRQFLVDRGRVL